MSSIAQEYFELQFEKEIMQSPFGILDRKNSQSINMNVSKKVMKMPVKPDWETSLINDRITIDGKWLSYLFPNNKSIDQHGHYMKFTLQIHGSLVIRESVRLLQWSQICAVTDSSLREKNKNCILHDLTDTSKE